MVPVGHVDVAVLVNRNGGIATNVGGRGVDGLRDPVGTIVVLEHGTVADEASLGVRDVGAVMGVQNDANLVVVDVVLQGLR